MEIRKNNLAKLEKLLNKALNQVQQLQKTLNDINDFKIQVGQQAKLLEHDQEVHPKN